MPNDKKLLTTDDIMCFTARDLPLIVFSDNAYGLFAWMIRLHEKGCYNHVMFMHRPGYVASQDWRFREVPIEQYFGKFRLKFVGNKNWDIQTRCSIKADIREELERPWYETRYDILGIVGQAMFCSWLNVPWLSYCSERVSEILRPYDKHLTMKHPSPIDLNFWMKQNQDKGYHVVGRYEPD